MSHFRYLLATLMVLSLPTLAATDHHSMHMEMAPTDKVAKPANHAKGPMIPELTDDDRAAAFPDVSKTDLHHMMDSPIMTYLSLDEFEWIDANEGSALGWDAQGWWGNDEHRLWWRTEGERVDGETGSAELQLLYGRPFSRWWDWVAGVRHDFQPDPSQTWLALGLQGLAPYWFETEATLFIGEDSQTNLRLEFEYELLLTNQLILQPVVEFNLYGKDDPQRRIGSGLADTEVGLRLRYEIRREIAPYVGLRWERLYGNTADFARLAGDSREDTAFLVGIRLWY